MVFTLHEHRVAISPADTLQRPTLSWAVVERLVVHVGDLSIPDPSRDINENEEAKGDWRSVYRSRHAW
jgi:hypothetical protein